MRYFIHLSYQGTNYSGWQRQALTKITIQEVIEDTLSQICKKKIQINGCGRTDAGVHASQYVFHVHLGEVDAENLKFKLNKNLPPDIAVYEIIEVQNDQHSRFDAVSRTYDYFLHWKKDPQLINFSSWYDDVDLDFNPMHKATKMILDTKDFKALCKQPDLYKNTICHISNSQLFVDEENGRLRFTITSNRFLRGMIRYCIFFLLKIGNGDLAIEEFQKILNQEIQLKQKQPALPNGLFLSKIEYSYLTFNESNNIIKMLKKGLE